MADSNITKKALANALKELMTEQPFEKTNVSHICERCHMNRKSFYYHFKDKYDLVNWIFDTEFIGIVNQESLTSGWDFLEELCHYLYENRGFYRKALKIEGQNSFSEHFREMLIPVVEEQLKDITEIEMNEYSGDLSYQTVKQFQNSFITDGIICAIERWLQDKNGISSEGFLEIMQLAITKMAVKVYAEMNP